MFEVIFIVFTTALGAAVTIWFLRRDVEEGAACNACACARKRLITRSNEINGKQPPAGGKTSPQSNL